MAIDILSGLFLYLYLFLISVLSRHCKELMGSVIYKQVIDICSEREEDSDLGELR